MSGFSRDPGARSEGKSARARGAGRAGERSPTPGNQQQLRKLQDRAPSARAADATARPHAPAPARAPAAPAPQEQAEQADIAALSRAGAPAAVRNALRGPGQALDPATLPYMEPRFGQDLSAVRLHTGGAARAGAAAVSARAFTSGEDIVLGAGEHAPHTAQGRHLIAHELTHVLQQRGGARPAGAMSAPGDAFEREADAVADKVASGRDVGPLPDSLRPKAGAGAGAPSLMRQVERKDKLAEYQFVPIEKGGTWDAPAILEQISQREYTETRIPLSQRGAGEESDPYRCGPSAVLASAIVGGPKSVMSLCVNLYKRIMEWRERAKSDDAKYQEKRRAARRAGTDPDAAQKETPYVDVCDKAMRKVFNIHWSLESGVRFGTHEGGGSILTFADFDRLSSYLYMFTLDARVEWRRDADAGMTAASPEELKPAVRSRLEPQYEQAKKAREVERETRPHLPQLSWKEFGLQMAAKARFRTDAEIGDAATMAGYAAHKDLIISREVRDEWVLDWNLNRLKPGNSLIGMWGPHTYTFFRNHDGKVYLYDSWRSEVAPKERPVRYQAADGVHERGSEEYNKRIQLGLTGKYKPIILLLGAAHPPLGSL